MITDLTYQPLTPARPPSAVFASPLRATGTRWQATADPGVLAGRRPRTTQAAVAEMREATAQLSVAQRAFFRYRRDDGRLVTGRSIHLARELARCWGNIAHGVAEVRRDETAAQIRMAAFAWDLESGTRSETEFTLPVVAAGGENNTDLGTRRLRKMIFAVLPQWLVEEADARCEATLAHGGGIRLDARITHALAVFEGLGVTTAQLEQILARPRSDWTGHDVAELSILHRSVTRGEINPRTDFPHIGAEPEAATGAEQIVKTGRRRKTSPASSGTGTVHVPTTIGGAGGGGAGTASPARGGAVTADVARTTGGTGGGGGGTGA
ncbi:hypothetical protein [Nocardia terpenica]|uniref:Uncharacterized protein n=1 Tax=Nocardia terpenica TaxID=455432 RepID=A0A291RCR3_9NOCA|nr:hypothetical protein [Nocardia terpenica]ATL65115.1 hypothetical protein CRH09_01590 [Nocardia terpenica]